MRAAIFEKGRLTAPCGRGSWRRFNGVAIVLAVTTILGGCGKKEAASTEEAEGPTPVTVEAAVLGAIDRVITADAVLYPVNQANVTSKISAPVKRVLSIVAIMFARGSCW